MTRREAESIARENPTALVAVVRDGVTDAFPGRLCTIERVDDRREWAVDVSYVDDQDYTMSYHASELRPLNAATARVLAMAAR